MTDRIVQAAEGPLAIHDLGGSGEPLLLAHATGFHGLVWRPLAAALAPRHRCWSFDFRGHGASLAPEDFTFAWEVFGRDVLAVIDALDLTANGPIDAVGHSKGGAALLMAEIERPGTFRRLFVFEPIVFPPDAQRPGTTGNPLADGARRRRSTFPSRDDAYANYAAKRPLSVLHPDALAAYVEHGFREAPDGSVELAMPGEHEARVFEMGGQHATFARLGEVRCPVVVAYGDDPAGPALIAPTIAAALADGTALHLDGTDHFGPLAQPERIAAEIEAAIAR